MSDTRIVSPGGGATLFEQRETRDLARARLQRKGDSPLSDADAAEERGASTERDDDNEGTDDASE